MSITDHTGALGDPAPGTLGGFEERLLAELKRAVFEQAADEPAVIEPGSSRTGETRPRLAATPRSPRTRVALSRRARAGLAAAGAIAAAAAALIVLVPSGGPSTGLITTEEQPLGSLPTHPAGAVLLAMAAKAERTDAWTGRYWCTGTVQGDLVPVGVGGRVLTPPGVGGQPSPASDYRYSLFRRSRTVECQTPRGTDVGDFYQYLGARPATSADRAAWRRAGSPTGWREWDANQTLSIRPGSLHKVGRTRGQPPWGSDLSLPADPAKLEKALLTGVSASKQIQRLTGQSYRQIMDQNLFWNLTGLLDEPVRPAVRAAAFRLLARVPGGHETPGVRDPQGRTGIAVWWGQRGQPDGFLIIDPETTMLLASEGFASTPPWVYKPGTMTRYDLQVSAGWASHLPRSR